MRIFKLTIIAIAVLLPSILSAQSRIETRFNQKFNDLQFMGLLGVIDACQVTATIYADSIDAKFYELWMVKNNKGAETRSLFGFIPVQPDSTDICITVMAIDSLCAKVCVTPVGSGSRKVMMPTYQCLLIECVNKTGYAVGDTIPLMAYSTGHFTKRSINGNVFDAMDVCGVRFSGIHPSKWYEKFNIKDFIYFEVVPVKEIDYNKF